MIVLLVLGIVVLALALLSLIRVGVWAEYAQKAFTLRLLAGPVKITLFPRPAKQPKPARAKKAKASKEKKKKPPKTAGEILDLVKQLLPAALDAAGRLRRKIRIDRFDLDVTVASADPARAAVNYGRFNGAIGMFWPLVEQNFKVKQWRIRTNVDFTTEHPTVYLRAAATLTIGQILALGVRTALRVLPILTGSKQPKAGPEPRPNTEKEAV